VESGPCQIGVVAAIDDEFAVQKIGITVFGNELAEAPVEWGFDDIVVERVRAAAPAGTAVRRIAFPRDAFDRYYNPPETLFGSSRGDFVASQFTTGGNKEFIANFEVEFPIVPKAGIRGVVFFDAGNVFAVDANFFQDRQYRLPLGLFLATGFGIRWFSPVGPLRFEWGIPLTPRPQDQGILFEFTIGNSF